MLVKLVDIGDNLFHSGVGLGNACALINNTPLNALNIGVNLINRRCGFSHIAGKVIAYMRQTACLFFNMNDHLFNFFQRFIEV